MEGAALISCRGGGGDTATGITCGVNLEAYRKDGAIHRLSSM